MPGAVGPDEIRRVSRAALDLPGVDGVEVLFMHEWGGLTRFASSSIHQSTWREDTGTRVRVVTSGQVGVASTNDFSPEGARAAAESAKEMEKGLEAAWSASGTRRPITTLGWRFSASSFPGRSTSGCTSGCATASGGSSSSWGIGRSGKAKVMRKERRAGRFRRRLATGFAFNWACEDGEG